MFLGLIKSDFAGRLSRFADEIAREEKAQVFAIRIDCSDPRSVREAFEGVLSLGFVEVLIYNAYQPCSWLATSFTDIRIDSFEKSLAVSSVGAFLCSQQVFSLIFFQLFPLKSHRFQIINILFLGYFMYGNCAGNSRHGGERKGDNSIHWMFSFSTRHCWFL